MSKPLRIAFVVEGPTDMVVIEAAISRILDEQPYVPTQLHPEQSLAFGPLGPGWKGVFRWCQQAHERGGGSLSGDPLFAFHDVLVLHLDADVAEKTYESANIQDHYGDLPCAQPCPPPEATTNRLREVLLRWAGETATPSQTVLCIPSKNTDAWVLAALFPEDDAVRGGDLECLGDPGTRFGLQPIGIRIRKSTAEYQRHSERLREAWTTVTEICQEAQRFDDEFRAVVDIATADAIADTKGDDVP